MATKSSTATNVEERNGLSRKAFAAQRKARRSHGDALLDSVLGSPVATHFQENPLDGPDIIGAMPAPGETGALPGPSIDPMSANDAVRDQAAWFEGTGREGQSSSAPKAAAQTPSQPMSIAAAASAAGASIAAVRALQGSGDAMLLTGLPGEQYEQILDQLDRPPNTY